jgi:Flp pilus assembly protein TadB
MKPKFPLAQVTAWSFAFLIALSAFFFLYVFVTKIPSEESRYIDEMAKLEEEENKKLEEDQKAELKKIEDSTREMIEEQQKKTGTGGSPSL